MFRALILSAALATTPALLHAGSLSWAWSPQTGEQKAAVQTAVTLYALSKALKSKGEVRQSGSALSAFLRQSGQGQYALIDQKGTGHGATVTQSGAPNALALVQRGRGAQANIAQTGGQGALIFQYGW
jgi:major curlin subunit